MATAARRVGGYPGPRLVETRTEYTTDTMERRKYRTEIPNIVLRLGLSIYELGLYVGIRQAAGENGECTKSTRTLAKELGISVGMVSKAKDGLLQPRQMLGGKALISLEERPSRSGGKPQHILSVTDIWDVNYQYHAPSSPHELASSQDELASSCGEINKEPYKKELYKKGEEKAPRDASLAKQPHSQYRASMNLINAELPIAERKPYIDPIANYLGVKAIIDADIDDDVLLMVHRCAVDVCKLGVTVGDLRGWWQKWKQDYRSNGPTPKQFLAFLSQQKNGAGLALDEQPIVMGAAVAAPWAD